MEIVKLCASDYDEWLRVLNVTFTKQNKKTMDFEKELPKMCFRDDFHMGKHVAVKEDGKICAVVGIYPIKTIIGGKEFTFSTVGNVATLPECEGRGYMRYLMDEAMKELENINADASRLGGYRKRYNRFGYELSATVYNLTISDYTTKSFASDKEVIFKEIKADSIKELEFVNKIRKSRSFYVERSVDDTFSGDYLSMRAWQSTPYIALDKDGNMIGYLCAGGDKTSLSEVIAKDFESLKDVIYGWQKLQKKDVKFTLMPFETEALRYFAKVAEIITVTSPSHFKIISFDKIADALIKLKASYAQLLNGKKVIGIEDWGNLEICVENGNAYCQKTCEKADFVLDKLAATRLLFGPLAPDTVVEADNFLSSVLPLPLTWNTLDRV